MSNINPEVLADKHGLSDEERGKLQEYVTCYTGMQAHELARGFCTYLEKSYHDEEIADMDHSTDVIMRNASKNLLEAILEYLHAKVEESQ